MAHNTSNDTPSHEGYITLDSFSGDKGDPGGFGFGGANGVTGGFGVGGAGPQPGLEPHRQAHYRERAVPGANTNDRITVARHPLHPDADGNEDYPVWLEGFPHSFHGWGPNAPDYDARVEAAKKATARKADAPIGFLEMTVMKGADPFATGLIWNNPKK